MADRGLTPLQRRVLETLAGIEPPGTLTGGAALVGFHLKHRTTRDLDLFWHGEEQLGPVRECCLAALRGAGFDVQILQRDPAIERLIVSDGGDRVIVDLVAEPVPSVEPPERLPLESVTLLVDTPHEILVNKLCALLGRAEVRDLVDVRALLDGGGDLLRALGDAPRKDAGFSPITLAWVLRGMPLDAMTAAAGLEEFAADAVRRSRDDLVERLLREIRPEADRSHGAE